MTKSYSQKHYIEFNINIELSCIERMQKVVTSLLDFVSTEKNSPTKPFPRPYQSSQGSAFEYKNGRSFPAEDSLDRIHPSEQM